MASMNLPAFVYRQFAPLPELTASFAGQTVIVTGSNIGLGLEAARHFARLGASYLILAVRSIPKGQSAVEDIVASLPAGTASKLKIEVWELDMSNWASIKAFVKRCEGLERLDAIVENAGIATSDFALVEGYESTIAVNVIGTFLLALGVYPILKKSAEKTGNLAKLVIVSSEVHAMAAFKEKSESDILAALTDPKKSNMQDRYNVSKLLEVLFIRSLCDRLPSPSSSHVVVNTLNPGLCHSSLSRNITGLQGWIFWFMKAILARRTDVGAKTLVAAAVAGEESHGKYMDSCVVTEPSAWVTSEEGKRIQAKVWDETTAALEKIWPGILKNI